MYLAVHTASSDGFSTWLLPVLIPLAVGFVIGRWWGSHTVLKSLGKVEHRARMNTAREGRKL